MSRSSAGYHHGNLRTALEDAALELLETQPAGRISLREVARRAGVSHNAPYHHFGDRAALLHSLGVRAMAELLGAQQKALATTTGPVERVRALGTAYVAYAADHPQAFALVFDPEYCPPGAPSADMAPLIAANEELLATEVEALVQVDGFTGRDPEALAAALWATVHGLAQLVMLGHLPREAAAPALAALIA
ncbi:TetR/AcrR family transcriptional regulator [Nocardioides piscis]|uniref:TetR/AcrR family transcriptional regulator n=1 Tax=Nocardioides piscis TaxID=2714938 RepID=A0A6G7YCB8_9ACTN|nr:TetR/AcrR family transcriptional regulator [Nocardioides piscis]QIK74369.1 TetR/AcrR family transcriptional regulator [Nocardioides piscis]